MKVEITRHAEQRMRERLGLNKKSIERIAQKAFDYGVKHSDTKGNLNKWISKIWNNNKNADNIRIYGDMIYIFCENTLVTTFHIPRNLAKNMDSMIIK